jgi:small basic protein
MFSFLTDFNLVIGALAVSFVSGVLLSTKVKDYIKGVPAAARAALDNVEADARAKLKAAQADVLAQLPGAVVAKVAAPATPAA